MLPDLLTPNLKLVICGTAVSDINEVIKKVMNKIINPLLNEAKETLRKTRASIIPFPELPGTERSSINNLAGDVIQADLLFSFFTADIIKESVIFTR